MEHEFGAGVSESATVLERPGGERALIWAGFPLLGVGAGWLLPHAADWAVGVPWLPLPGWVELIAAIPPLPAMIGGVVLGLLAGVVLVLISESEFVTVTVDGERIAAAGRTAGRDEVAAVFCDGKDLVVLGRDTGELLRARGELPGAQRLRRAVEAHGYPWFAADPHGEEYRRWVPGLPQLPIGADALFTARAKALEKKERDDAAELREELGRLGVVVQDRDSAQHWRLAWPAGGHR